MRIVLVGFGTGDNNSGLVYNKPANDTMYVDGRIPSPYIKDNGRIVIDGNPGNYTIVIYDENHQEFMKFTSAYSGSFSKTEYTYNDLLELNWVTQLQIVSSSRYFPIPEIRGDDTAAKVAVYLTADDIKGIQ